MKILNIILSVVVLLLAAVSAYFAYVLYGKRIQMAGGWSKMTAAIHQTAAKMDEKSGTTTANDLTEETLSYTHYADLDARLDKLKTQAANLIRQRDALASSLREAGMTAEMPNPPQESQMQAMATYSGVSRQVVGGVHQLRARRDLLIRLITQSAGRVSVPISAQTLKSGDAASAFRQFDNRVSGIQAQFAAYRNTLSTISALTGGGRVNFTNENYAQMLAKVTASVNEQCSKLNTANSNTNRVQRELNNAQQEIKKKDGEIATIRNIASSKDEEITQYRRALGMDASGFKPWKAGSKECRRAVRGRVVAVNERFGYIGINLGTDTLVRQPLGGKSVEVNPKIAAGMIVSVARNVDDLQHIEYIAKVKLTTVDTDTSIGETLDLVPDQQIQVGDVVFLQEEKEPAAKKADQVQKAAPVQEVEVVKPVEEPVQKEVRKPAPVVQKKAAPAAKTAPAKKPAPAQKQTAAKKTVTVVQKTAVGKTSVKTSQSAK